MDNKTKKQYEWNGEDARVVEGALKTLVEGLPEIDHLEGCSYVGIDKYAVQFMYGKPVMSEHCELSYISSPEVIVVENLTGNPAGGHNELPERLEKILSEKALDLLPKSKQMIGKHGDSSRAIYGVELEQLLELGRSRDSILD